MATTINQLYCTHCTYGTSALHRHTGNVRTQPFEYSTRAGSVEKSISHQTFQRFEQQFFRGIPMAGDAPVDVRRRDATGAPWRRLVYSPSVDGLHLLANVCYRTTDTAGRLGSYFAHVLIQEASEGPWNPVDCLKLWGAPFWTTADKELSDSEAESFELARLDSLNQDGSGTFVNDHALTEFLTNDAARSAADESKIDPALDVFPARWRRIPAAKRQQFLTDLLHAVMELDFNLQERLTIAVEPAVAALLFYGIFRLLPPALGQPLSFSTFESHLERSATVLTAHDFADHNTTDLLPETYRIRGFVINTYRSLTNLKFRHPESRFAAMMVQSFIREGADAKFRLAQQLPTETGLTRENYESLATVHQHIMDLVAGHEVAPELLTRLPKPERQFAGRVMAFQIAAAADDDVKNLARSPAYLWALDLVTGIVQDPTAKQAVKRLVTLLPPKAQNGFFALPKLSSAWKVAWLKSHLQRSNGQFPQNCPSLWFDGSSQPNEVLSELLRNATPEQASAWQASVPAECLWSFAAALAGAAQSDPGKRPLLATVIEKVDDDGLCKLLDKTSGRADAFLANFAPGDARFQDRLGRFSDGIRTAAPDRIAAHVETLLSLAPRLAFLKVSLNRWGSVRDAVGRCKACVVDPSGRLTRELEVALTEVLKALGNALSDTETEISPIEIDVKLVESLMRGWLNPPRNDLLQQAVRAFPMIQLAATDDTSLCSFLAGVGGAAWRRSIPSDDASLQQRLRTILDQLPDNLSSLPVRLEGLAAARQWLGPDVVKLGAWQQLVKMLEWVKQLRGKFRTARDMNSTEVNTAASDLGPLIFRTLGNRLTCDPSKKNSQKLAGTNCLENLSRATIGDNTLTEALFIVLAIERAYEAQGSSKGGGVFAAFLKR